MSRLFDPDLLGQLEALPACALDQKAWRVTWASRPPLMASGGGRWSTRAGPRVIYCSEDQDGALAEVYHHLSKLPVRSSAEKQLHELHIRCDNALDLRSVDTLESIGVTRELLQAREPQLTQAIGAAAHFLEFDAMLVPSLRWECANLVAFEDRLDRSLYLDVQGSDPVNFAAWRERVDVAARLNGR